MVSTQASPVFRRAFTNQVPQSRVVAVVVAFADGSFQTATGYLIGGGFVLTAAHCTRHLKSPDVPATIMKVIRLSDKAQAEVTVAELAGRPAISPSLDLALLAVSVLGNWMETSFVQFGRVKRSHDGELVPCKGIGLPAWQIDPRSSIRGSTEIRGLIRLTEDPGSGDLVLRDPVLQDVHALSADGTQSAWAGMSGTLVFYAGYALGTVVEHHGRQGSTALQIRPLDKLVSRNSDSGAQAIAGLLGLSGLDEFGDLEPGMVGADWSSRLASAGLYVWEDSDFEIGLTTQESPCIEPIDAREIVDLVTLREGRLPNLSVEFARLSKAFGEWSGAGYQKRGEEGLRVLWLVGERGPRRSMGLLACMSQAGALGHVVADAGKDARTLARGIEQVAAAPPESVPVLIGVDLDDTQSDQDWQELADSLSLARRRYRSMHGRYPLVMIAGTATQEQAAYDRINRQVPLEIQSTTAKGHPHQRAGSDAGAMEMVSASLSREHVFNRGLPATTRKLFGRDRELQQLRDAWASDQIRIATIVAYGGTGKSALVNTWLREMRDRDYLGARKVLAWSFYSQGTKDNLVSADPFVSFALSWLGDDTAVQSLNPHARGDRLAELIEQHNLLLVLDGMEPLQYPLNAPNVGGQFTDGSIRAMLQRLAKSNWNGLCVITTRVPPTDLKPELAAGTVVQWDLENLDSIAAAGLLRQIIGGNHSSKDLQQAVDDMKGHALAVTLLGNYLRDVHQGNLAYRHELEPRTVAVEEGGHARRVMASYEKWLRRYDREPELAVLLMIGLFDRPAAPDAMRALLDVPDLAPGLSQLERIGSPQWNDSVQALRQMGLLNSEISDWPGTIDAHPLVREHFREQLRNARQGQAWTAGNHALFGYYQGIAPWQPSQSDGMSLLYGAVTHGCAAGLHQQVFDELLLKRIWRDRRTNYSTRHLGMTGSEIVALSNYFQHHHWTQLHQLELSTQAKVLIMTNAGVRLRQLGRTLDAQECCGAVLQQIDPHRATPEDLQDAAYAAAQYCELLVIAGKLSGRTDDSETALHAGRRAIEYASQGTDPYFLMHAHSCLGEVQFMLGEMDQARELFELARQIGEDRNARPHFLYSQSLFRYGYFLIETGRPSQILADSAQVPGWGTNGDDSSLLSQAIRLLVLGAACRSLLEQEPPTSDGKEKLAAQGQAYLNQSVDTFRSVGYADYIVRGLLERANFYRVRGRIDDYAKAMIDLDDATFEATRGKMDLLYLDVMIQRAAAYLGVWPTMTTPERLAIRTKLKETLAEAEQLIKRIRYHRRRDTLAELQAVAAGYGLG